MRILSPIFTQHHHIPTPVIPYVQVNGAAWQNLATATVTSGDVVNLGPQPLGGAWSWTGPGGFTSSLREIDAITLTVGTDVYVATYTDPVTGLSSSQAFTITVNAIGGPAYYVSASGSDSNSGTFASPFLTLAHAQSAMRGGSTKTTYLRGGTYTLSGTWTFSSADNNTTWQGYPGETAVIDGAGAQHVDSSNITGITWRRLVFNNLGLGLFGGALPVAWNMPDGTTSCVWDYCTFQNMNSFVFQIYHALNCRWTNNTFQSLTGTPTTLIFNSAIAFTSLGGNLLQHNLFFNTNGQCIGCGGTVGPSVTDTIDRNKFLNVCLNTGGAYGGDWDDGAAIYCASNTNTLLITNNWIENVDPTYWDDQGATAAGWNGCRSIYLDNGSSNCVVTGNTCKRVGRGGIIYNGGRNNIVENNIFDVSSQAYCVATYNNWGFTDMASNTFRRNIIYTSGSPSGLVSSVWEVNGGPPNLPNVSNNLYFAAGGGGWPNPSSGVTDTAPTYANPQFVNPSGGNYSMPGTSPAFTVIGFTALPTDIGPQ